MSALPTLSLQASFIDNPRSGSPTWTDITTYLRSITTARGRQINLPSGNSFDVGQATIVLDNRDGRFDPTYTAGAYYPHVIPRVPIRFRATRNAVTYPVYLGYANGWPPTYTYPSDELVTVTCVDALGLLAGQNVTGFVAAGQTDARISYMLLACGLNSLPQSIDAGITHLPADPAINDDALGHCQAVELTEDGAFYCARDGTITFENRYHRAGSTSQGTFGDGGGSEIPYTTLSPNDDITTLVNYSDVTDALGVDVQALDSTSIAKYGGASETLTIMTDTPNEGYDRAQWDVQTQKDHSWRVAELQFSPMRGSTSDRNAAYAQALGREISDLITVKRRPPSGNVINQNLFIERIEHDVTPHSWVTRFGTSPVRLTNTTFFKFNDTSLGKFNSGGGFGY